MKNPYCPRCGSTIFKPGAKYCHTCAAELFKDNLSKEKKLILPKEKEKKIIIIKGN